ncbi:hypothetical protein SRDD_34610 [Serratia sp. DD3]|nr:hypothetical protein SRDD_34610 [Serratia sp. DD3]
MVHYWSNYYKGNITSLCQLQRANPAHFLSTIIISCYQIPLSMQQKGKALAGIKDNSGETKLLV